VSGFSKQTVESQESLVFCVSKSFEDERERVESLERNERVCGKSPTPMQPQLEVDSNWKFVPIEKRSRILYAY